MRRVLFLAGLLCLAVLPVKAQDPVKVDPKHYKVDFENAQVRVLRINVGPHEKTPLHEHPASVVVWLTDAHVQLTLPDGKTQENSPKAGQAAWEAAAKHWGENLSGKPFEVIQVELKAKPAATQPAKVQSGLDPVKVDPKHNKVEFENAQVRVLRANLGPHEKNLMHEHPANVVVFLTAAHVKFTFPDGKTEERHGKAGQSVWGAGEKHEAENVGDKPMEVIQIELKAKPGAAKPAKKKAG